MNAGIRPAVLSDGERPRPVWRIKFGSPSAFLPNAVGLTHERLRNVLTRDLISPSSVSMPER